MLNERLYIIPFIMTALMLSMVSCQRPASPREYGYYRITIPPASYSLPTWHEPYRFLLSDYAYVQPVNQGDEQGWMTIIYPAIHAGIHCSYKVVNGNLRQLIEDAHELVYSHTIKANAIPEHEYFNAEHHVYGVLYELKGNTASPIQFYLTDSVHHFFRGAVYVDCIPNQDSLQPVIDYLHLDILTLIESFEWR